MNTQKNGNAVLLHGAKIVGRIMTNRHLTIDEALELVGVYPDEMDGGDPVWDYDKFRVIYLDDGRRAREERVLDYLQPMTLDEVREDFGGKTYGEIKSALDQTYIYDDNAVLACQIYDLLTTEEK